MIITCPSCATRFNLDPHALGDEGRAVRCVLCGYTWFQSPSPDLPKRLPDCADEASAWHGHEETSTSHDTTQPPPQRYNLLGWLGLGAFVIAFLAIFYWARDPLVRVWPSLTGYYRALGIHAEPPLKLVIEHPTYSHQPKGDKTFLVVEGHIKNISEHKLRAPHMRVMAVGHGSCLARLPKHMHHLETGAEKSSCVVMEWSFIASGAIGPEGEIPFHTHAEEPEGVQIDDVIVDAV